MSDYDNAVINITQDINNMHEIINLTSGLWVASKDEHFKLLLDDASRANGALLGALLRQLKQAEHFRDNPPPKS